jgi:hypothetical protein
MQMEATNSWRETIPTRDGVCEWSIRVVFGVDEWMRVLCSIVRAMWRSARDVRRLWIERFAEAPQTDATTDHSTERTSPKRTPMNVRGTYTKLGEQGPENDIVARWCPMD